MVTQTTTITSDTPSLAPTLTIPLIDISDYLEGSSEGTKRIAAAIHDAAVAPGFFQVVGHPISPDLRRRLLEALEAFFALPAETKQSTHRRHSPCLRGYEGLSEQELEKGVRDQKEGFMIGREQGSDSNSLRFSQGPNQWPDDAACPGFQATLNEYFDSMRHLSVVMFRLMALSLGLEEKYFDAFADSNDCTCCALLLFIVK